MIPGWTLPESPFHAGEQAAQDRLGLREALEARVRRAGIRNYLPDPHRAFFNELPFLLIGSLDEHGQPWATMRVGPPGFITSPDAQTLHMAGSTLPHDPSGALRVGDVVGALGIQFHTRRRNRVNGVVAAVDDQGLTLAVSQSFGNCNKYIQARVPELIEGEYVAGAAMPDADQLSDADQRLIRRADTLFIASANLDPGAGAARGADVSHKGGRPGFVRVDDARTLTVPDFIGNSFFNTVGNLACDSRAGLLFIDFESGDLLYLAARAEVVWDGPDVAAFTGAQRLLRFHLRAVRRSFKALPIRWTLPEYARELANTGVWPEAVEA
jgi:predicted pyridoxine 5'-phosphate oxidase superfamily flavin-nucleotide-binding protein